jgi:hypothetical protein
MAKAAALQVLTANRLRDGEVVYWQSGGAWVGDLAEAEIFEEEGTAKRALEGAARFVAERVVVNPYLFAVARDETGVHPLEERERIRAAGPTIRRDLGKQAVHVSL